MVVATVCVTMFWEGLTNEHCFLEGPMIPRAMICFFWWWPKKTPKCPRGSTGSSRFASERTSTSPLLLGLILVTTPRRAWGFTMLRRDISWDEALKPDFSLMIFCTFFVWKRCRFSSSTFFATAWYLSILYVQNFETQQMLGYLSTFWQTDPTCWPP